MSIWTDASGAPSLIAVVGPTASGKSGCAMDLAQRYGSEIICADSRTVYKGLDIGTAKPSADDQRLVPHWGLDLVGPGEPYTVANFQLYAKQAIADIQSRKKIPILVGGSGLYVDSVLYDFEFAPPNPRLRQELGGLSVPELQYRIHQSGLKLPENAENKRYLLRTLERGRVNPGSRELDSNTLVIGLDPPREQLLRRVQQRALQMFSDGVVQEVQQALLLYGPDAPATSGGIYTSLRPYLAGDETKDAAIERFVRSDMALAKKQRTWFRRHSEDIYWFESAEVAIDWVNQQKTGTLELI